MSKEEALRRINDRIAGYKKEMNTCTLLKRKLENPDGTCEGCRHNDQCKTHSKVQLLTWVVKVLNEELAEVKVPVPIDQQDPNKPTQPCGV